MSTSHVNRSGQVTKKKDKSTQICLAIGSTAPNDKDQWEERDRTGELCTPINLRFSKGSNQGSIVNRVEEQETLKAG